MLVLALPAMGAPKADFHLASWVWADANKDGIELADGPGSSLAYFRKSFDVPEGATITQAVLSMTADNAAQAWINGKSTAASNADWKDSSVTEVSDRLLPGRNVIAVFAQNIDLPTDAGGVIAQLTVHYRTTDGKEDTLIVGSDHSWKAVPDAAPGWEQPEFADAAWGQAVALVPLGGFPWRNVFTGAEDGVEGAMPEFLVNGDPKILAPLRDLLKRHFIPGVTCALWDPWLPRSLLWVGSTPPTLNAATRNFYSNSFLGRKVSTEGYVEMRQHRGLGLPDGWPFPFWTQGPGAGWHFSVVGNPFGTPVYGINKLTNADDWTLDGAVTEGFDELKGWMLNLEQANASITTPMRKAEKIVSPYLRLEWRAEGLPRTAQPYVEWTTEQNPEFSPDDAFILHPSKRRTALFSRCSPCLKFRDGREP